MSLAEACLASLARAAASAALALPLALALARTLPLARARRLWLALLAAWVLLPPLAIGYAWANLPWAPLHARPSREALHVLLLALRLAPLAALVLWAAPHAAFPPEAWHAARLLGPRLPRWRRALWWLRAHAWAPLAASLLVLLVAFHDFELAALLAVDAWTVWLFDSQAGGQSLGATLAHAAWPWLLQALFALVAVLLLGLSRPRPRCAPAARRWHRVLAGVGLAIGSAALLLLPAGLLLHGSAAGLEHVLARIGLVEELGVSLVFAAAAACSAACLAAGLGALPRRWRLAALLPAVAPALLGSLSIGLLLLALSQRLGALRDGPLPLLAALTLLLLPVAALWYLMLAGAARDPGLHLLSLLPPQRRRRLWWRLRGRQLLAGWSLLLALAYADLSASSLLAPLDATPVLVRLHNLMHYGRSHALSGMLLVAVLAPALLLGLVHGFAELLFGRRGDRGAA